MKTLFLGLAMETTGLVWDLTMHSSGAAAGEGLIEPAHVLIFAGFVVSFVGAVLVWRAWRRR